MIKSIAIIAMLAFCKAEDYYQMSIDHSPPVRALDHSSQDSEYKTHSEYKSQAEPQKYSRVEIQGYESQDKKTEERVDRSGDALPSTYGLMKRTDDYDSYSSGGESYSSPYGYERAMYEKPQRYEKSYGGDEGYGGETYIEKSYSSPIYAKRNVEIKPIQSSGGYDQEDHTIDVKDDTPIVIHFRTHANQIRVEQTRVPDKPKKVEHTRSEDEPHRVVHEVYKPVIQEIREIIQPFRKVVQQVQPVVEEVQTVIHKADKSRRGGDGGGGGNGSDGYNGGDGDSGYRRQSYGNGNGNNGYSKRSSVSSKKHNTLRDYVPQGSVQSAKGVPVYRSQYKGPAQPEKKN